MPLTKKDEKETADANRVMQLHAAGLITFDEAREMLGLPPMPPIKWESINQTTGN
jgi:hypothetical protein